MELSYLDKQFILLTKGHFEEAIIKYSDIKEIVAEVYGLYPNQVREYNIFNYVNGVFDKLCEYGYINTEGKTPQKYLLNQIYYRELSVDDDSLLDWMISEISNIKSISLNLGEPDGSLLPLKKVRI